MPQIPAGFAGVVWLHTDVSGWAETATLQPIYMNGGLERLVVEYYKTYIQRTMSGKFRPDLPRIQSCIDTREKFHYAALVIIAGLSILYLHELGVL